MSLRFRAARSHERGSHPLAPIQNVIFRAADPAKSARMLFFTPQLVNQSAVGPYRPPRIHSTECRLVFRYRLRLVSSTSHRVSALHRNCPHSSMAEQLGLSLSDMAATQKYPVVSGQRRTTARCRQTWLNRLKIEGWCSINVERGAFWCVLFRIVRDRTMPNCRMPPDAGVDPNAVGKLLRFAPLVGTDLSLRAGGLAAHKIPRALDLTLRKTFLCAWTTRASRRHPARGICA